MKTLRGFTLIELLVVIAIIGILSSVVMASLNTARTKGNDANRMASIHSLQVALELYYLTNGQYPSSGGASSPNSGWSTSNDSSWTTLQTALAPYIPKLPTDPSQSTSGWAASSATTYTYSYYSQAYGCDRQWYMIVWRPQGTVATPGITACDGTNFNYGGGTVTVGARAQ